MQRRFRQVCTAMKEHSVVNYAKIATVGGFCNVDHIVVKATAPNDMPLPEKYVHELLKVFSISGQSSFRAFSRSFTRRFGRTSCWRVALKCLLLLHRLLRSVPQNSPFRSELLWTRTNGLISLYPCRFVSFSSQDYTLFIRSYAHLLDEALNYSDFSCEENQRSLEEEEEKQKSLSERMKEVGRMLELLPQLQSLIERVMECRPAGAAARSFVVKSAMKHIIRDSFGCYDVFRREIIVVLDNLFQMPYGSCVTAFGIYKKAAVQANQLCEFYDWCKAMGLCGTYEYPFIERIPFLQIQALESFLGGMWQFTDDSSSPSSPLPSSSLSSMVSPFSSNEDNGEAVVNGREGENSENKGIQRKFCVEEEKPLIELEEENDQNVSWETLLEESVNMSIAHQNLLSGTNSNGFGQGYGYENFMINGYGNQRDATSIQVYNPKAANPFHQPWMMQDHQRSLAFNFSCYSGPPYNNLSSSSK